MKIRFKNKVLFPLVCIFLFGLMALKIVNKNSDTSINISKDGIVKINNYSIIHPITNFILDSLFEKSTRIKFKKGVVPHVFVYDNNGISAGSAPCQFKNELKIRSVAVYFQRPFKSAPLNVFQGNFIILGNKMTKETKYADLINNPDIKNHINFLSSESTNDFKYKTGIELKIEKTYISFWFNAFKNDSTLISVNLDLFAEHVN